MSVKEDLFMTGMSCYVFTLTNKHNCCSFSNDDGDDSEHVTMNMNSNFYIVDAFIPTRFKCWSLIQSSKRGKKCLPVFTSSIKRRIRNFTSYSCSHGKEMNKKACSTCEIVVLLTRPNSFNCDVLVAVAVVLATASYW